jgi:hypothetical protein
MDPETADVARHYGVAESVVVEEGVWKPPPHEALGLTRSACSSWTA